MELITITKRVGHFDLFHDNEKEIQYKFWNVPLGVAKWHWFCFPDEDKFDLEMPDHTYSALEFSKDLKNIAKKHFLWWDNEDFNSILKYLEDNNEEQELLMREKYKQDLLKEKDNIEKRLAYIQKKLDDWE